MKKRSNPSTGKRQINQEKIDSREELDNVTFQNRLTLQRKVLEKMINPGIRKEIEMDNGLNESKATS